MVASFTVKSSADGKTLTFTDTFDWTGASLNKADYVRSFLLTDYANEVITTLTLPASSSDSITYNITKDLFLNVLNTDTGAVTIDPKLQSYGFDRILVNKFQDALMGIGCCANKTDAFNINMSADFWLGAIGILPTTNNAGYQLDLDTANTYINIV